MKKLVEKILLFIFPKKCASCGKADFYICPKCRKNLPKPERNLEDWITSVWSYKDAGLRRLLWLLKFHGRFNILEDLSDELYDEFVAEFSEKAIFENFQDIILVPIPITRKKFRKRGYNQAELIAKVISGKSDGKISVKNFLEKIKETTPQSHIKNRRIRLENIRGCFSVKENINLRGKNIVIIDDITTTFGTLKEARKVLRNSGARKIYAFTIAH